MKRWYGVLIWLSLVTTGHASEVTEYETPTQAQCDALRVYATQVMTLRQAGWSKDILQSVSDHREVALQVIDLAYLAGVYEDPLLVDRIIYAFSDQLYQDCVEEM